MPLIETKVEGAIGTICLDYFEKRNALSQVLVEAILAALDAFAAQRVRVLPRGHAELAHEGAAQRVG